MIPPEVAGHCRLLLEPWCLTPAEVARLTNWQVRELYLRPHDRMIAELKGEHPPGPPTAPGELPDRLAFVLGMTAEFGGTREKWEADYDRLRAELDASGRKGH